MLSDKEFESLSESLKTNLSDVERGRLVLKLKDKIAAKARENQRYGINRLSNEAINTRNELAKIAGISHGTLSKIEKIDREAPAVIREAVGKAISVDKAARLNDILKQLPEGEREAGADAFLSAELLKRHDDISREKRIMKKLHNIYASATLDYEFICADCVDMYIGRSPVGVAGILSTIDDQMEWLIKLKRLFIDRSNADTEKREDKWNTGRLND